MKADGELRNTTRPEEKKEGGDGYKYDENNKERLRQEIKDREQKIEQDKRQLEEDKKRLNDTTKPKTTAKETIDDNEEGGSKEDISLNMGSPVFTLANMFN